MGDAYMKKIFISALSVLLSVLLFSCAAVPDTEELSDVFRAPFEAEAVIQNGKDVYAVSVCFDGSTQQFKFSEPVHLYGVRYVFSDGESSIIYNDLRIPVDLSGAADKSAGGVPSWKKLLEAGGEYTVRRTGEQYIMTDGETEYSFEKETKIPVCIKSGDITITFISFRVKNDKTS